jgi:4'-phosphopantetheinyl transferase
MAASYLRQLYSPLSESIQLWLVQLDAYAKSVSPDELGTVKYRRAMESAFRRDSQRLLAGRHILRRLIARALETSPTQIKISPDHFGKPRLDDSALQFNISYCGPYALIGMSRFLDIGVDLEIVRDISGLNDIAKECFTIRELSDYAISSDSHRERLFYSCWTRKEACVKSLGTGFRIHPSLIDVGHPAKPRIAKVTLGDSEYDITVASLDISALIVGGIALSAPETVKSVQELADLKLQPLKSML